MSFFNKKSSEFDEQESQGSGKSKGSLLVLLVLLAGFAYLYFFTSLIVPHETAPLKAPDGSTEVKQSLPPKPAALLANQSTAGGAKLQEAKPAVPPAPAAATPPAPAAASPAPPKAAAPVTAAPAAAKPAAPPAAAKPAAPAQAQGSQTAAKPAAPPQVPAAPKKEAPVALKKEEPKSAKAVAQKPAQAALPKRAPESAKVTAPEKQAVAKKPAATKKTGSYAVFAGEFPAGAEAAAAEAKLVTLGIKPVSRQVTNKSKSMHRLFYGAYTDYDLYAAELARLRQSAKGTFGVEKDGKYFLYAGSFLSQERAELEKKSLAAKGVTLQSQLAVLPVSTVSLTAGRFTAKGDADKAAARIKRAGLSGKVVSLGR